MKRATLVLAAMIAMGGSFTALTTVPAALAQSEAATQTTVFAVENMYCELCPLAVKTAMERVPGVTLVVVDFDDKTATVTFDPAIATMEAIAAASTNLGYPAHVSGA